MYQNLTRILAIIMTFCLTEACSGEKKVYQFQTSINEDWQLFSSVALNSDGQQVSQPDFTPPSYYKINIPATVLSGLIQNGLYPDLYFGGQLEAVDQKIFETPWWYRKTFILEKEHDSFFHLIFEGINQKANIWLNGQLIAGKETIDGPFGIWQLDVSEFVVAGKNTLAVEVFRPEWGDLTIGFVDWSPEAPDNNMGLWRGVVLKKSGPVSIHHPFVTSKVNTQTLKEADLTISTQLRNHTGINQKVNLEARFNGVSVSKTVELLPHEAKEVVLSPDEYKKLHVKNPKLWWPVNLGEPHLYNMEISASVNRKESDLQRFRFGIRQIEEYRTPDDHLGFKVNGQEVLIKGGGWVDDMLLADTDEKVIAQVDYVKHMNLNTIRLEGFWGRNKTLFDRCDEQGIMLMIGWSCQWEWAYYSGREEDQYIAIRDPKEQKHQAQAYTDQVRWLRNHPSVFLWNFGSDKLPRPELELLLRKYIAGVDTTRPLLSACKGHVSEITGTTGVKMNGPYDWVSPNYWYIDQRFGGAFGFNTETGPGPQIPTLESIKRMIPESDLWPRGEMWDYHSGRFEFRNLDRFLKAFNARYGEASTLKEFVFKNQISNYEAIRPMFEAFAVNKPNATGIIQWMLNSAWPKIIWQLYDYYLVPNAAFYGTKKANSPLVPIYNYGNNNIYVHNEFLYGHDQLTLAVKVLDINSKLLFEEKRPFNIGANQSKMVFALPSLENLTTTYFLDLRLFDKNGKEIIYNFYWLSTRADTHDWDATYWVYTPGIDIADMTGINSMPKANVILDYSIQKEAGQYIATVRVKNQSEVLAFFMELRMVDRETDRTIVPVFWDDNYISLLPGEERTLKARISVKDNELSDLGLKATGWNVEFLGN
ncbi:MAG TPA: glycoside hydrolase family 2 TIM barrel-domain containing protein [Bacteroidales bacterium]|nr:glycoside hydrolase family 2 TIM barrel-domain containing protein [Bacteroidales bacterium]